MKNVTISLDEDVLKAARVKAAEEGVSLQEFLRRVIRHEVTFDPVKNLEETFAFIERLDIKSDGKYPTREQIYERPDIRRHKRLSIRERQEEPKKAGKRGKADRRPDTK